jgi:hypothetical protein
MNRPITRPTSLATAPAEIDVHIIASITKGPEKCRTKMGNSPEKTGTLRQPIRLVL